MLRLPNRMACLLIAAAAACGPAAAAEDGRADVRIVQQGPVFVIDATLHAPVVPELAWQVLTDFERMETFVPNLADSRIVARDGPHVTILQHGIARFGPFSIRFESERVVTLAPPSSIRSVQTRGSMDKLESLTTFAPAPGGTALAYHVEAIPGALYPDVITRRFLAHEVTEQFEAIVREMVRRRDAGSGGGPR
jgi:hypothetical protein